MTAADVIRSFMDLKAPDQVRVARIIYHYIKDVHGIDVSKDEHTTNKEQ